MSDKEAALRELLEGTFLFRGAPQAAVAALADLFKVLGDPTRIRILQALHDTRLCVCDIAETLGMTQSAISHQLRVLRQARLVRARREGRSVFYALDDDHVAHMFEQGLLHVSE